MGFRTMEKEDIMYRYDDICVNDRLDELIRTEGLEGTEDLINRVLYKSEYKKFKNMFLNELYKRFKNAK